ncbi:MAG TPA: GAF domain-containing SpoIIE family protein phosphatase [Vicinamibacteria bacterium]|nr:GAF domain-containing SpoIIE family protein phosphatase [Vicinamibacteria bacterium]
MANVRADDAAHDPAALARQLDRTVARLGSLLEATKALAAATDLDAKLEVILARATEVMQAERSSLFIYDEGTGTLWNRLSGTLSPGDVRIALGAGLAGDAARSGRLVNVPDAYLDPRFERQWDRETQFRTRSVLCAPLFTHSRALVGVLQVLNKAGGGAFDADDEALMEAFASHAGIAIDTARLVEAFLEKERIEASLRLAQEIQAAMLPRRFPVRPEVDLSARISPARMVGGDLYDFLLAGDRLWFLVGDVSGKGVSSALFMAMTKTLFRATLQDASSSPAEVLGRVNRELSADNERAMFVTAFLGCLDLRTGEVVFANGGHNPPYRLEPGGGLTPVTGGHGAALGILEGYLYETASLTLAPGEGLVLFTDGVTEALDPAGEQFSEERLEAHLRTLTTTPAVDVVGRTFDVVRAFAASAPASDDITVMSLRYLGPGARGEV